MSPRFVLERESVPCVAEVVNRSLKADCTDFTSYFFLQFRHIFEIDQKAHNTTTSRPPVPCILQILTSFNLYSGRPRVGLSVNNKQRLDKQWLRFEEGGLATTSPPPPPSARYAEMA